MLKIEKIAPAFSLVDQDEIKHSLKQYQGKYVLLYFYPKDDTPGCAKEACMIADVYKDFSKLGIVVLGVSKDSSKSHKKFATKYNLPFTLLSDPEAIVIEKYEAWVTETYGCSCIKDTIPETTLKGYSISAQQAHARERASQRRPRSGGHPGFHLLRSR